MIMNNHKLEIFKMTYNYNPYWERCISETFTNALNKHPRIISIRVDLRLPNISADTDAAVISRFIESLKAKIDAYQQRKVNVGQRIWPTSLHYVWAREFGESNGKKHYHVVLLLNRDTWCSLGNYNYSDSLAGMIKQAWCSALRVNITEYATLAHFPESPVLWINKGNHHELDEALKRANYLAKNHTKITGNGERNFGRSTN